jgi:hypothetical protein
MSFWEDFHGIRLALEAIAAAKLKDSESLASIAESAAKIAAAVTPEPITGIVPIPGKPSTH